MWESELRKDIGMHQNEGNIYTIDHNGNIDESAFIVWKDELKKNLPRFWQSMQ